MDEEEWCNFLRRDGSSLAQRHLQALREIATATATATVDHCSFCMQPPQVLRKLLPGGGGIDAEEAEAVVPVFAMKSGVCYCHSVSC